jgi:hypothetical protein
LEILAVILVDLRATIDSMKRSVTNAQSSVEQFRHTQNEAQLTDIASCLDSLKQEVVTITETVSSAEPQLAALRANADGSSPSTE